MTNQITPQDINRFLNVQEQELHLKLKQEESRQKENQNNFDLACKNLEAQERDLKNSRDHYSELSTKRLKFYLLFLVIILVFLGYTLYMNKEQIALECIKLVGVYLAGGASGYAYAVKKKTN